MKKFSGSRSWLLFCILLSLNAALTVCGFALHLSRPPHSVVQHEADTYIYLQNVLWVFRCLFSGAPCLGAWLIRGGKHRAGAIALEFTSWVLWALLLFFGALLTSGTMNVCRNRVTADGRVPAGGSEYTVSAALAFGILVILLCMLFFVTRALRYIANQKRDKTEVTLFARLTSVLAGALFALLALNLALPQILPALRMGPGSWPEAVGPFYFNYSESELYVLSLFANGTLMTDLLPPDTGLTAGSAAYAAAVTAVSAAVYLLTALNARRFAKLLDRAKSNDEFIFDWE